MKELYLDYIQERLGKEVLVEPGKAFIIYEIQGEEIYIQDIYVAPEYRKTGIMEEMEMRIESLAIKRGCTYATGSVQPTAFNSTSGLEYCLKRGYELLESGNNYIILKEAIGVNMGEVQKIGKKIEEEAERVGDRFVQDPIGTVVGGGTSTFVAPAPPSPPPIPGFPTEQDVSQALEADAEMQEKIRRSKRGRSSTILTGAKGLAPIEEGSLARKTLLA